MARMVRLVLLGLLAATISVYAQTGASVNEARRVALVVGNADYEVGPLANPVNDAGDVATALRASGFEVQLTTDRTLVEMERDLRTFRASIRPGDVAFLFYAGHGVQVDGANYLLPIDNGEVRDDGTLRRRSIDAQEYVTAMAEAGARLNIVVLDACRDNPLPRSTRSAARGLAVIQAPPESETVIVYATRAGDVAADGDGRNSTFTAALLTELAEPDRELIELFNAVGSSVREQTEARQVPAIYTEPLSDRFVFNRSAEMAARAEAARLEAQAELDRIEADIARRRSELSASQSDSERQRLELELERQQALESVARLNAETLAAEAARRAAAARSSADQGRAAQEAISASLRRQAELEELAAERRAELQRMSGDAAGDDPDAILASIRALEEALGAIDDEYRAIAVATEAEIRESYAPRLALLDDAEPEIWETDEEFASRIEMEQSTIDAEQRRILSEQGTALDRERVLQTESVRAQLDQARRTLASRVWETAVGEVLVEADVWDRNARRWPVTIASRVPYLPVGVIDATVEIGDRSNAQELIVMLDETVRADALVGHLAWSLRHDPTDDRYIVVLRAAVIESLIDGRTWQRVPINADVAVTYGTLAEAFPSDQGQLLVRWSDGGAPTSHTLDGASARAAAAPTISASSKTPAAIAADAAAAAIDALDTGTLSPTARPATPDRTANSLSFTIAPGDHTLRLEWGADARWSFGASVAAGRRTVLDVAPPTVPVSVRVTGGAAALTLTGNTIAPITLGTTRRASFLAYPGEYEVNAAWESGLAARAKVSVTPGRTARITVERPRAWELGGTATHVDISAFNLYAIPTWLLFRSVGDEDTLQIDYTLGLVRARTWVQRVPPFGSLEGHLFGEVGLGALFPASETTGSGNDDATLTLRTTGGIGFGFSGLYGRAGLSATIPVADESGGEVSPGLLPTLIVRVGARLADVLWIELEFGNGFGAAAGETTFGLGVGTRFAM